MKNLNCTFKKMRIVILSISIFILSSCNSHKWTIQSQYLGNWKADKSKITVRTEPKWMKFEFTSDSAVVALQINEDKTVNGSLGQAKFVKAKLNENGGILPLSAKGVIYTVELGMIGKIYPNDPLSSKELEIWIQPITDSIMKAELRFTQGGSTFPMADLFFKKEWDPKN